MRTSGVVLALCAAVSLTVNARGPRTPLGLGDFFFDPDDPLHPDRPTGQDDDED